MTWGSILVLAIIIIAVAAVVAKMIRDKKNGKSSCGCDCSSCGGACGCCGAGAQDKKSTGKSK